MASSNKIPYEQVPGRRRDTLGSEALRVDLTVPSRQFGTVTDQLNAQQDAINKLKNGNYEPYLGLPTVSGQVLASTISGSRYWTNLPTLTVPAFIVGEIPSGAVDGVNRIYALANLVASGSFAIYEGPSVTTLSRVDASIYGVVGSTLTFTLGNAPPLNSFLRADYRVGP